MHFEALLVPFGDDHEIQFNNDYVFWSNSNFVWIDNTTRWGIGLGNPRDTIEVYRRMVFDPVLFNTLLGEDAGASITSGVRDILGGYQAGRWLDSDDNTGWGYQVIGGSLSGETEIERDEAVVVTSNTRVWILDADYTILNELSPGNDCMTLDIDNDGNIYFGVNNSGTTDSRIRRWDINGNWEPANFYTPTGGWPNSGSTVRALRLSPDGAYLYADLYSLTAGHPRLYKFDNTTGSDVWVNIGTSYWGMYVDADGLIYRPNGIYDEDGNLTQSFTKGTAGYGWDVYVDEANNRAYFAGQGGFAAIDTDDTNYSEKRLGSGKYGYSIKVLNEEVFGTGDRTQNGVGGAWANVYKYDTSLNITASYDLGATDADEPWHVWFDKDNQVIVRTDETIYIFDTDLNLQDSIAVAMGTQAYRGEEGRAIFSVYKNYNVNKVTAVGSLAVSKAIFGADDGAYFGYKAGGEVTTHSGGVFLGPYSGCHQTI